MSKVRTVAVVGAAFVGMVVGGGCIGGSGFILQRVNDEYIEKCDNLNDTQKAYLKVCNHVGTWCASAAASNRWGAMVAEVALRTLHNA